MAQSNDTNPSSATELDADVAARLDRLTTRRATTPPSRQARASDSTKSAAYASPAAKPAKRKRRHAAAGARQAAFALSLATTGGLTYAMSLSPSSNASRTVEAGGVVTPQPVASTPIVVNGDAFSNRWGVVQVQATFEADGGITSVTTLQTPDADGKSVRINDQAVPTLNAEALASQSANVDTVSGATYTSDDYRRSLQSAIDTARASGLVTAGA